MFSRPRKVATKKSYERKMAKKPIDFAFQLMTPIAPRATIEISKNSSLLSDWWNRFKSLRRIVVFFPKHISFFQIDGGNSFETTLEPMNCSFKKTKKQKKTMFVSLGFRAPKSLANFASSKTKALHAAKPQPTFQKEMTSPPF